MRKSKHISGVMLALAFLTGSNSLSLAQDADFAPDQVTFGKREYSPYLDQGFPDRVYFGDTHLHTSYSTDAGMVGNRLGPEEAYRFARGEEVISSTGLRARLQRPLDFLVVSDHAENLGLAPMIAESNPGLLRTEFGRPVHDLVKSGQGPEAYNVWIGADERAGRSAEGQRSADPHHVGTSDRSRREIQRARQLHRHDRLRVDLDARRKQPASQRHLPRRQGQGRSRSFRSRNTTASIPKTCGRGWRPTRAKPVARSRYSARRQPFARPDVRRRHLTTRKPIDRDYAERRMRWEPLYEVTQMKGDGEAHVALSPNDEFAGFETWDRGSFGAGVHTPDMLPREYAREALKRGLAYEQDIGVNPFKFGMIGSTDAHTSLANHDRKQFLRQGRAAGTFGQARPFRRSRRRTGSGEDPKRKSFAWQTSASGLAAVWATRQHPRSDLGRAWRARKSMRRPARG